MGNYRQLFSIELEHAFYGDLASPAFRCIPTAASIELIHRRGLLLRATPKGIAVFVDRDLSTDSRDDQVLAFRFFSNDPYFTQYTILDSPEADALPFLHCNQARLEESGRWCLHASDYVDAASFKKIAGPELAPHLDKRDALMKPGFVIAISLACEKNDISAAEGRTYYLRFAARKSIWKYYFISQAVAGSIAVVDLDNEVGVVSGGAVDLPGKRRALVFLTDAEIEMRQRYAQRFQLREQNGMGERVLIKRLPHADVSRVGQELVEGRSALVSEIYIN